MGPLRGRPFVAVPVEVTSEGWTLASILGGPRLRNRRTYASVGAGVMLDAGFELLATFAAPHYSVVFPSYTSENAERLASVFGDPLRNDYFGRSNPA